MVVTADPVVVSIPHRLGREEAIRRLKRGLGSVHPAAALLMSVDREEWTGDQVQFVIRALGQSASGTIEVFDDHLRLKVTLPWLLAKVAERFIPALRKQTTLLLEKK
jgi:hypothetical protein